MHLIVYEKVFYRDARHQPYFRMVAGEEGVEGFVWDFSLEGMMEGKKLPDPRFVAPPLKGLVKDEFGLDLMFLALYTLEELTPLKMAGIKGKELPEMARDFAEESARFLEGEEEWRDLLNDE